MCDCNNRLADIASMGLGNFLLPLGCRLGLEPRSLTAPDFKSVQQIAVCELYQDTIYNRSGASTNFANDTYLET